MSVSTLSQRASLVQPSATMAISTRAGAMRRSGIDVISLAAGEPDFDTPKHIQEAGIEALRKGRTRYTPAAGTPELRAAAAKYISKHSSQDFLPSEIVITCGAKQAIFNTLRLILDPGDSVLIPAPCWVTYPAQAILCDGVPLIAPPKTDGSIDIEALAKQIPDARALVLCNPSNPSGQVLSRAELRRLGDLALEHGTLIIADEIYSELVYESRTFDSFLQACPDLRGQTIVIHGVSKTYSMTGLRIGFCAAPEALAKTMSAFMSQTTSNPTSTSQWAALAALEGDQSFINTWKNAFEDRRNQLVAGLKGLPGINCRMPEGAFYVFPDIRELAEKVGLAPDNDIALAERILEEAHVAVVPGSHFHAPGHVRMSYATSLDAIHNALRRVREWIDQQ